MFKNIAAVIVIYIFTCVLWAVLGSSIFIRSEGSHSSLKTSVESLWGTSQTQQAPLISFDKWGKQTTQKWNEKTQAYDNIVEPVIVPEYLSLESSDVKVNLNMDYRKKGLNWYSTYKVNFKGDYIVKNNTDSTRDIKINFQFPNPNNTYDNFIFKLGTYTSGNVKIENGMINENLTLQPGEQRNLTIAYNTNGLEDWRYNFGNEVNQVKNFKMEMTTDFERVDFPDQTISPTKKTISPSGTKLNWDFGNLLSGVQIGVTLPERLNPGPWAGKVTFFAPVSLFFFFFLMLLITAIKKIELHPMHYFFMAASFFSFHLLLAYLIDHINIHIAFMICSVVSIGLVVSYLRLVVSNLFAFREVIIIQFIYLVFFSYTFFFERYTGLSITILSIVTLFVVMQLTARINWREIFGIVPTKDTEYYRNLMQQYQTNTQPNTTPPTN
jgi:inner membrane protein involved in colicin E2 resistance